MNSFIAEPEGAAEYGLQWLPATFWWLAYRWIEEQAALQRRGEFYLACNEGALRVVLDTEVVLEYVALCEQRTLFSGIEDRTIEWLKIGDNYGRHF